MLFHTVDFLLFFALLYAGIRMLPRVTRPWLLLAGSFFFYAWWKPPAALLLLATALFTYFCALCIERDRRRGMVWGGIGLAWNLGWLIFFKYGSPEAMVGAAVAIPIGISFYTFQLIGYLLDVQRGLRAAGPRDLLLFSVYFPQLIAGPIERAARLLPRLQRMRIPGSRRVMSGLLLAGWGFFKKLYIADNLTGLVRTALEPGTRQPAGAVSFAACVFAVQLYADFSGYVDIARGLSRTMGIELSANFRLPILAIGPAEFWRRWHITLYAFFRDYLYIPLGGNRAGRARRFLLVNLVFVLGGIWHGTGWPFALWGLVNGLLVALDLEIRPVLVPVLRALAARFPVTREPAIFFARVLTFLTFAYGLLLFHVESTAHALELIENLTRTGGAWIHPTRIAQAAWFIWPLPVVELWLARPGRRPGFERLPLAARGLVLAAGTTLLIVFGVFGQNVFYYFQF